MRIMLAMMGCAAIAAAAGCESPSAAEESHAPFYVWTIDQANADSERNAVVRQSTIFPYHFVHGTSTLTEIGEREVQTLAQHFRDHPGGQIGLRRGDASDALYAARRDAVLAELRAHGLAADAVTFGEGLPGGDAMPSRQALLVLERADKPQTGGTSRGSGAASGVTTSGGNQ